MNSSVERARLLITIDTQSQQIAAVEAQPKHPNPLQEQVGKLHGNHYDKLKIHITDILSGFQ